MSKTAEIFSDGGRQAIRLPGDIHLTGTLVDIRQNEHTGEIILSPHVEHQPAAGWGDFFKLRDALSDEERAAFEIPRDNRPPSSRDIF